MCLHSRRSQTCWTPAAVGSLRLPRQILSIDPRPRDFLPEWSEKTGSTFIIVAVNPTVSLRPRGPHHLGAGSPSSWGLGLFTTGLPTPVRGTKDAPPRCCPHSLSSLYHWKSAGGTAMASQRRRAARPRAVRALVTSVMVGGSGRASQRVLLARWRLRGLPPVPCLAPSPDSSDTLPPRGPRARHPLSCQCRGWCGVSQLTVTSTRRLSGTELTPL